MMGENPVIAYDSEYEAFLNSGLIGHIYNLPEAELKYSCRMEMGDWAIRKQDGRSEVVYVNRNRLNLYKGIKKATDNDSIELTNPSYNQLIGDYYWGKGIFFRFKDGQDGTTYCIDARPEKDEINKSWKQVNVVSVYDEGDESKKAVKEFEAEKGFDDILAFLKSLPG